MYVRRSPLWIRAALIGSVVALLGIQPAAAHAAGAAPEGAPGVQPAAVLDYGSIKPGPEPAGLSAASSAHDVIPPVAERIYQLGHGRGFAGQRTDYDNRSITVHWSGTVPSDVRSYIASTPYGVNVNVVTGARYSRAQTWAARDRVLNSPLADRLGVVSASAPYDGRGVVIGVQGQAPLTRSMVNSLRSVAGIDGVEVRYGAREATGYASRINDSPPWKGGIRLRHGNGALCSSGFAVLINGYGRLLSARHCDPGADASVRDGAGESIAPGGTSVSGRAAIDSLLIDPSASPATIARIYRGGYASSSYSTVRNWYSNWPGDPVCSSGASTGEHCGTVYDDSDYVTIGGVSVNVIQVRAPSGSIMGGQGDSGGAMFKKLSNGVQARGILLGPDLDYSETTSCGAVNPDAAPIRCSRYINYVPISTILNTWGARLEVA